ncbi:MAG: vanadium-dependent haloperoxidase [Pseudarcicella sp.]|nr:vanadium-dependent haloperoxidase [Pseudarcicella sp.]
MKLSKYLTILSLILALGCKEKETETAPVDVITTSPSFEQEDVIENDIALQWSNMTLFVAKNTKKNTPTYASRGFGYIGLTMYESVVQGSKEYSSLEGQLNDPNMTLTLPKPDKTKEYNWVLSLNAGQASIIKNIYDPAFTTDESVRRKIDSLETVIYNKYAKGLDSSTIKRSTAYGREVAKKIYEWSKTDGGDKAYTRNLPTNYTIPVGQGFWVVPTFSQTSSTLTSSLHPTWGNNRTFISTNQTITVPKAITYSTLPNSDYYAQMLSVRNKKTNLTQEEREIAAWWGDDPAFTFTPPGHSYNIAQIAAKKSNAKLFKSAQSFAAVGMAIADAFVNCWKCKYTYNAERPSSYIKAQIDPMWISFFPEPPFPAFPSGHATQGSACATVLTQTYGSDFAFEDNSHENRADDVLLNVGFKNRRYNSFWEAAEESAYSRFLGGIHTNHDNQTGLTEGRKVGSNVNKLKWKK